MTPPATVGELIHQLHDELSLTWDGLGGTEPIRLLADNRDHQPPIGPLNLIRPNQIQVIGPLEQRHLERLGEEEYRQTLEQVFAAHPVAILFSDGIRPKPFCRQLAEHRNTALIYSDASDTHIISRLQYAFSRSESRSELIHGVFLEVLGKGVLLSGDPSVGKSELALALISLGHRLVADDMTEFTRIDAETLSGRCPPVLQDFLEVRGLGLLNIRAMFGDNAIKPKKNLHLIIDLQYQDEERLAHIDRLDGSHSTRTLLDVTIPQTTLPVAAGRNLATLVETAVRQQLLRDSGYIAADDFAERQRRFIEESASSE